MILTSPWGSSRRSPWGSAVEIVVEIILGLRRGDRRLGDLIRLGEGERLLGDFLNTQIGISYLFVRKKNT